MAAGGRLCACCGSAEGVEEHHLYLKADGCPDDLTVFLCHVHHGQVHEMHALMRLHLCITGPGPRLMGAAVC